MSFVTTESDQLSNPEHQEVNILSLPSSTLTSTNQQLFSYPEQINVPENQQVEVVYVNNPSSFYIQTIESIEKLEELARVNAVYSGNISIYCFHEYKIILKFDCSR